MCFPQNFVINLSAFNNLRQAVTPLPAFSNEHCVFRQLPREAMCL